MFSHAKGTTTPALTPLQYSLITACHVYNGELTYLTQEAIAKQLTPAQILSVNQTRTVVYPVCSNSQNIPTDPTSLINTVLQEVKKIQTIQNSLSKK